MRFSLLFLQTNQSIFIKLLQSSFRIYNCTWITSPQKANIESCIKTLADVGECRGRSPAFSFEQYSFQHELLYTYSHVWATRVSVSEYELHSMTAHCEALLDHIQFSFHSCVCCTSRTNDLTPPSNLTVLRQLRHGPSPSQWTWTVRSTLCLSRSIAPWCSGQPKTGGLRPAHDPARSPLVALTTRTSLRSYRCTLVLLPIVLFMH